MIIKSLKLLTLCIVVFNLVVAQDVVTRAWPHENSDVSADASVIWGRLPNGMRYAIMPNTTPVKHINLRLLVEVGSLDEADGENGVATLVQALAFQGTTTFPSEKAVAFYNKARMAFGPGRSATTGFEETVFRVDLPTNEAVLWQEGVSLLRSYVNEITMKPGDMVPIRQMLVQQAGNRNDFRLRTLNAELKFHYPENKASQRLPLGSHETILTLPRNRIMEFYRRNYTVDRLVFVAVGDFNAQAMEKTVKEAFGDLESVAVPVSRPPLGTANRPGGLRVGLNKEADADYATIGFAVHRPMSDAGDTAEERRASILWALGNRIMFQRFQRRVQQQAESLVQGMGSREFMFDLGEQTQLRVVSKPLKWKEGLKVCTEELRRALQHGFLQSELDEAKASIRKFYGLRVKSEDERFSKSLADGIVRQIIKGRVFTRPSDDLPRIQEVLSSIGPEDLNKTFREVWSSPDMSVFLSGAIGEATPDMVKTIVTEGLAAEVAAPVLTEAGEFGYKNFGPAGLVLNRREVEGLEVTQLKFSNNARLNVMKSGYDKGAVQILARFGRGRASLPRNKPGLDLFASSVFIAGGLQMHTQDELQRITAENQLQTSFTIDEDAFILSGNTTPEDLELQLQIICAYLIDPGFREETMRLFKANMQLMFDHLETTAEGINQAKIEPFIKGNDYRYQVPNRNQMQQRNLHEVRAWMEEALKSGYLEVSIIGDIDVEKTIETAAVTIGAIPERQADRKPVTGRIRMPGKKNQTYFYETDSPRTVVTVYWPTQGDAGIGENARLNMLASVFGRRLRDKVKTDLGDEYRATASNYFSESYAGYGHLKASVAVNGNNLVGLAFTVEQAARELGMKGMGDEEFAEAQTQIISALESGRKNNAYWLSSVLARSQEKPEVFENLEMELETLKAMEAADIKRLANRYLQPGKAVTVQVVPK